MKLRLKGWGPWLAIAVVAVVALGLALGNTADADDPPQRAPAQTTTRPRVTYRVTTSEPAQAISLTYENASGNTEQVKTATRNGRWESSFAATAGQFVYVSVQNQTDNGSVTCEILYDGARIEYAMSSGAYVIATCSGRP